MPNIRKGSTKKKSSSFRERGVYENFLTIGGGSTYFLGSREGGVGKNLEFSEISTHPPLR